MLLGSTRIVAPLRNPVLLAASTLLANRAGCGDVADTDPRGVGGASTTASADRAASTATAVTGATTSTSTAASSSATGIIPVGACGTPMPRISDGVPAFASDGTPGDANDGVPSSAWHADTPAWLAYDLGGLPEADRHRVVVAWYAIHAGGYLGQEVDPGTARPTDYRIEANAADVDAPPDSGWVELANVAGNTRSARQHDVDLAGARWIRLVVSQGSDAGVGVDLDVHRAPDGPTDAWLLMGDSITFMSTMYAFSDLPERVATLDPSSNPVVVDAGIGGTNTGSAMDTIDDALAQFTGCFVALAYGTNDHADSFTPQMEALVQKVVAAGKTPVVPRMPWSSGSPEGEAINAQIDALYAAHPEIVRGPDLWSTFEGRTDLIPVGDVHPNQEGMAVLRQAWAETIAGFGP